MAKAAAAKATTIDVTISKSGQTAHFVELLTIAGAQSSSQHRIRVKISSDSYQAQSSARIERWDGEKWQEVWTIEPHAMRTAAKLAYVRERVTPSDFVEDRDVLVERAIQVLL